jgi:hypothetical protein
MPRPFQSRNTIFGPSPQLVEPNTNGIAFKSNIMAVISALTGRSAFAVNQATVISTGDRIDNGALLDEELRLMIQNIQEHFMIPFVEFRMDRTTNKLLNYNVEQNLEENIQDGFLQLDPSTNVLTRNVDVDGVTKTTTEKLMIDLNGYLEKTRNLPKNFDISKNEIELMKQDDAYLLALYGLKTLTVTNRGLLCWIENRMLNATIIALQKEQIESSQMQSSLVFDIAATAVLDIRYLAYLKKHVHCPPTINGEPNPDYDAAFIHTGVFDAALLAAFI